MKLEKDKIELARQLAWKLPYGASIVGIIRDLPGRSREVLIRQRTGIYTTQLAGRTRSIDQRLARQLIDEAK